jgi:hypothetical protein
MAALIPPRILGAEYASSSPLMLMTTPRFARWME